MARTSALIGVSLLVHASLAAAIGTMHSERRRESTTITLAATPKKAAPPPVEPPRPAELPEPTQQNTPPRPAAKKAAATPPPAAEAPRPAAAGAALDALPDFGLALSGGVGSGGMAVPTGGAASPTQQAAPAASARAAARPAPKADDCDEPVVKPKALSLPSPSYTPDAIEAKVEGKVRVELTLDEQGKVVSARVLAGLGHGLDERALAAARSGSFSAATRCGKPTRTTFVVGVRFAL